MFSKRRCLSWDQATASGVAAGVLREPLSNCRRRSRLAPGACGARERARLDDRVDSAPCVDACQPATHCINHAVGLAADAPLSACKRLLAILFREGCTGGLTRPSGATHLSPFGTRSRRHVIRPELRGDSTPLRLLVCCASRARRSAQAFAIWVTADSVRRSR